MRTNNRQRADRRRSAAVAWLLALAIFMTPLSALAQATQIKAPDNKYKPNDDVQLGRQAAAQVERQLPLLPENGAVDDYVERVGSRLAAAIPPEFRHPQFGYQFDVVNARDINAFALPGGPMYVNRGMIEAAQSEGEMAGVMAHEIAHVALRHGTAQATKAQSAKFQLPAIIGAIGGAIIGGSLGNIIAQGTQFGLSTYFLKYSRDYERQADILGAQIMARAGYDPRDLANMFRTIERESGGRGGPEWLSSHPNPSDRYERINEEAKLIGVQPSEATQDTAQFNRIQAGLHGMSPAPTLEQIARGGGSRYPEDGRIEGRVEYPSVSYRTYAGGDLFRVSVPDNWRESADNNSVTFAPRGAYGQVQGQPVFTHGAIVGVANAESRNLQQASNEYIDALLQANPYLHQRGGHQRGSIDGRPALAMTLAGRSPVTGGMEIVTVYTSAVGGDELLYVITVAPQNEYQVYDRTFQTMLDSIQING